MKRALNVLFGAILALLPVSVAAAGPSPALTPTLDLNPTLDRVLLAPGVSYAPLATANPRNGPFTAHQWAETYGVKNAEAERLLGQDGFVDGYTFTWASQSPLRVVNEFALAFQGGRGAGDWFTYDQGADTSLPVYQHADTLSGIPRYFGVHEIQSSVAGQAYLDGFVFVKGNDVIGVEFASRNDDNLDLATAQAKSQYAAAPESTIPSAQWPENVNSAPASAAPAASSNPGGALPYALIIGTVLVAIGLAAAVLLARTRRAAVAPAAVIGSTTAAVPVTLPLQMSADGNFWYDGRRWVDVGQEAPPFAPRSPDGSMWWDGWSWRPVPLAQPPV